MGRILIFVLLLTIASFNYFSMKNLLGNNGRFMFLLAFAKGYMKERIS